MSVFVDVVSEKPVLGIIFGIAGAEGSGKSVVLKALAKLN
jgi:uridine kinase